MRRKLIVRVFGIETPAREAKGEALAHDILAKL
jgi:hypothetical protein